MAATGPIDRFLAGARRRHSMNLALEYLAVAASTGAGGVVLLLLLGTQVFNWYWPLALFLSAAVVALALARRRRWSTYRLAQVLDARLGLEDRLSTLIYFRDHDCRFPECLETVRLQTAERLAHEDVARVLPLRMPRHAYFSLALMAAAGGLLGLRYGVLRTLDLSQPIARLDFGLFHQPANAHVASRKSVIQERLEEQLRQLGLNLEDNMAPGEDALQPVETTVPSTGEGGNDLKDPSGKRQGAAPQGQEEGESGEQGDKSAGDASDAGDGDSSGPSQKGSQQNAPKDPKQGSQGANEGLMNKMKDALANLLNKMKMGNQGDPQQSASANPQAAANARQQAAEQGMQSRSKSNGEGQPSPDQQGQEGQGEQSIADQSRSGDRAAEKSGNQDSKTGMGRQDGAKDILNAEQLAALGKISEIFGKRAQQITGEMTVEVSSSKQSLKTAYSSQRATHADTGAEVNRDEIPLAYQSYVQRYFEEVRKTATQPASAAKTKP